MSAEAGSQAQGSLGMVLQSLPNAYTWALWINPVQTSPGVGASEQEHMKLHSTPRTKSFGRHVAPGAYFAQSTEVFTVSPCHPAGPHLATDPAIPHRHYMKGSQGVAADPESCHSKGIIKLPP